MRSEETTFTGANGDRLSARLDRPLDMRPAAWVLFAHCFTCSKDLRAARDIAQALTQAGLGVFRFDFTGLGESGGDFEDTDFSSNIDDLVAAAGYMAEELAAPQVLVGHSLGGAAVLCAAMRLDSVRAVATIASPSDADHVTHLLEDSVDTIEEQGHADVVLAGRKFRIRDTFLRDVEQARVRESLRDLRRALLIFHSPIDEVVGIDNAARLFEAAKHPKSFVSLDDADHLLTDPADSRYVGSVLAAWAERFLDAPAPSVEEPLVSDGVALARIGGEGLRTDLLVRKHALVADEPEAVGGDDAGPTPYDLLGFALGACTAMTLRLYADRKGWPLEEARIRLAHRKVHARDTEHVDESSARMDRIERTVELLGPLDETQRTRLVEIAERCPVHRTLHQGVDIRTELHAAGET
jgi:uncharacterized OsmC-like protein/alpha/beta superfamily hydrolase